MCISAIVNGSTVEYALQSTGSQTLGWMAMGFGDTMEGSPMVIMWPNSDGSITLSQRKAPQEIMPTVDSNPPRIATLAATLSTATTDSKAKFVYTISANSDTKQSIIWAFGTIPPSSSAKDATLQEHLDSGTLVLDLTKTTSTGAASPSATPGSGSSSSPSSSSNAVPLAPYQRMIVAHAIFCTIGFLLFLPAGALLARYFRTFTPKWFTGHYIAQFYIAGPTIVVGVALGIKSVVRTGGTHFNDDHKKWGLAIFILYLAQIGFGAFIHWVKPKNRTARPPQNYGHAVVGLAIIGMAFYQVRQGFRQEWVKITGRQPVGNAANIVWYVWVVLLPVLYLAGLVLLRRQFSQEQRSRNPQSPRDDEYKLATREYRD
jgi:hypothetical protein